MSALHLAAFNGHEQEVHSALRVNKSDINVPDDTTTYPVMWASSNGHDRIVGFLLEQGADYKSSNLEPESIWREFPNMPTPPPCPAENGSSPCSNQPISGCFRCVFYPSYEKFCAFSWTGPDPLSHDTCADAIFLYVSAFLLFERVNWIEPRLNKLSTETKEAVEEYPFFLPRVESMLGNLRRIRGQISDILSQHSTMGNPRVEVTDSSSMWDSVLLSRIHPSTSMLFLDPQVFVQNIVGN
ncbi:uncharacterized protein N7446_004518 [Penicillium canescens]|uniref:uncharacterized protein n=1 Tax=Penicillium canescens TaxID=5083 RepID=UPI0026DF76C4|nr:uncharacterized protein N7446_004518 [Penicillium canescens]KAJ6067481.1 hypothetical protein N7446_004518 [Penicillium canescens]